MPSYHIDCGNSTAGPVGFCIRVDADTPEDAIDAASELLADVANGLDMTNGGSYPGIEYAQVYVNPDWLTVRDIDEVEFDDGTEGSCPDPLGPRPDVVTAIREMIRLLDSLSLEQRAPMGATFERLRFLAGRTGLTAAMEVRHA